jgi:folate-binding protein YgfZ
MFYTLLHERAVIRLSGEDVIEFLQGLISNNARLLLDGKSIYAALLSPQGRFLHDFFLIPWQGKIFIDVRAERVNDLFARLKIYRLRSKIDIEIDESMSIAVLWNGELAVAEQSTTERSDYKTYQDPRLPALGLRAIGSEESINDFCKQNSFESTTQEAYERARLMLAVPDTRDMIIEKSLLLECGFEQLNGVDFNKGCYVGQEVTARSKFRGQVRKSFYHVEAEQTLPEYKTAITADDKIVGEMRTSLGNIGIALLYNDKYEMAINDKIAFLCADVKVAIAPTQWIKNK